MKVDGVPLGLAYTKFHFKSIWGDTLHKQLKPDILVRAVGLGAAGNQGIGRGHRLRPAGIEPNIRRGEQRGEIHFSRRVC